MPPPPAIGSARPLQGEPGTGAAAGERPRGSAADPGASVAKESTPDESATQRWTALGVDIAEDDGPADDVGSRSLPIGARPPSAPSPPEVSPLEGASTSSTSLKVPSLGPPAAVGAASESAGSWPRTDGWDLDEPDSMDASASVPSVPKPAASTVPSVPRLGGTKEPGSVPSVPKLGSVPTIPKLGAAATKDAGGSVPSVPKLGSVPSIPKPGGPSKVGPLPKPGAAREVGSVPSMPKLGAATKPAPLPRSGGGPRPATAARHRRAAEAEEDVKPLFGTALTDDGSLAAGLGAGTKGAAEAGAEPPLDAWASFSPSSTNAAAIDALAPPSSDSPLDALPSFDAGPPGDGAPQDGFPSLDSSMLVGATLEPLGDFEPTPVQAGLAPVAIDDDDDPAPSIPRLPIPGMLRDGFAPAADFRATPRTPRSPQPPPAMATPRGMVPPKLREGEEPRLKPGDTQALVAQVTEELIEELDRERTEKAAATAAAAAAALAAHDREAAVPVAAAAASARPAASPAAASVVPIASSHPSARAGESKRRGMVLGIGAIGVAAAIGLFVWLQSNRDSEPPTQTAAASTPSGPTADDGAGVKPEPPTPVVAPAVVAPAAEAAEAASTSGPAEVEPAATASSGPEPTAESQAGDAGAEAPSDAEASPEPANSAGSGSSSRKSSGKSGRSGGKSSGDAAKDEPTSPPPAKTDDAPTAAKLLKQARSAYDAGKGSTAYSLASKSNRMEPTGAAAEVMALAACQMKDADKAKSALRTVPLFSRASVRNTCKTKHGVKLGL